MTQVSERPKPFLFPQFCKGCGRCIEACPKHCITIGTEINPATGLVPVVLNLEQCNGCGLCLSACPEPYGLAATPAGAADYELQDPAHMFGARPHPAARRTRFSRCPPSSRW
jgi:NAD-dependent dihydropyrimidine dehydrogenase PreA subunit